MSACPIPWPPARRSSQERSGHRCNRGKLRGGRRRKNVAQSRSNVRTAAFESWLSAAAACCGLPSIASSRSSLAIGLFPDGKGDAVRDKGQWKILGETECAEGQNRTAYAGLFRAA